MRKRTDIQQATNPNNFDRTNILLAAVLEVLLDIRDLLTPVQAEPERPKHRSSKNDK